MKLNIDKKFIDNCISGDIHTIKQPHKYEIIESIVMLNDLSISLLKTLSQFEECKSLNLVVGDKRLNINTFLLKNKELLNHLELIISQEDAEDFIDVDSENCDICTVCNNLIEELDL